MDNQADFGSMEHFFYDDPSSRELPPEEYMKAYDKWAKELYWEMQADCYISIAKDQISED